MEQLFVSDVINVLFKLKREVLLNNLRWFVKKILLL